MGNNELIEKLTNDINKLQNKIKHRKIYNVRNFVIKSLIKNGIAFDYALPFIVSAMILASSPLEEGNAPFQIDEVVQKAEIEMIDTSSGRHLEYISYDTSCDDKLIEYSTGWIINNYGLYERTVTSYRLNYEVNLEETEKILSMTKAELEGILTVTNVRTIQKNSLDPEDSIYDDDAIIVVDYIESNDKTLTRLETNRENISHSFLCVLLTLILGWCIVCGKKVIFKTYIRDQLRGYASYFRQINEEELEKMKKILELEQKNLSMLRGESLNFGNDYGYSRKLRKDKRGGSNGE